MPDNHERSIAFGVEINAREEAEMWVMSRNKVRWTKPELATLRDLAGEVPVREIAHWLDRSEQAVRFKAWQEHLKLAGEKAESRVDCAL
jgi:long-subunit acyl-CoA synthetase (AMP-forming)